MLATPLRTWTERSIDSRQTRRARIIAQAFTDLDKYGFDLALHHYHMALNNSDSRQKAINIAIALENLYLTNAPREELTFHFRLHILAFSRRLPKTDRIDGRQANKLYAARSTLVHGGKRTGAKTKHAIDLLNSTGLSLLRATLLSVVSQKNRAYLQDIGLQLEKRLS